MRAKLFPIGFILFAAALLFATAGYGAEIPGAGNPEVRDITVSYPDTPKGWHVLEVTGDTAWRVYKACQRAGMEYCEVIPDVEDHCILVLRRTI